MVRGASIQRKPGLSFLVAFLIAPPLLSQQKPSGDRFQPPDDMLVAGLRETATHRGPIPELRISEAQDMPGEVTFWIHVDAEGRVLDVRDFQTDDPWPVRYPAEGVVEAIRKITYRPFLRNGVASEAWVQDRVRIGTQENAPDGQSGTSRAPAPFPAPAQPLDFTIKLSRSGCYGMCPSYSVAIHGDGAVEFHGNNYVAISGEHQARIAPEEAARLLDRFRAAGFFGLKDTYQAGVTDNPTYCLELSIGDKRKTITDYVGSWVGMPSVVSELEEAVDETAGTDRWVSAGPQTLEAMREAGIASDSSKAAEILRYAVSEGKAEAVRSLLAAGAPAKPPETDKDVSAVRRSRRGGSLLVLASFIRDRQNQGDVFKALLENAEVRADRAGLQDALGRVVADGNVHVARILIAAGADPGQLFHDTYDFEGKPDQTYLMRAAASGVWEMLDDALRRPHDIHAVDSQGRSAVGHVLWSAPPLEDILPLIDRLVAAGAGKEELSRALCDSPRWREGLIKRGADPHVCGGRRK